MRIGIAQIQTWKGNIEKNIEIHKALINMAISNGMDAIFFSELSISGYEPELANELKVVPEDERFTVFQELSDLGNMVIGIGAPTIFREATQISMLIFQPNQSIRIYSKQILHEDELPYFVRGEKQLVLECKDTNISPAICYESLQINHLENAIAKGATIYLAIVAKSQTGIEKAMAYFPNAAKTNGIPILMSNCVGDCDNFKSVGQSAVWNKEGKMIGQLADNEEGILVYDTIEETTMKLFFRPY